MRTPKFNNDGVDKETFAPIELINALDSEWKDVRLSFTDWEWLKRTYGDDSIDEGRGQDDIAFCTSCPDQCRFSNGNVHSCLG